MASVPLGVLTLAPLTAAIIHELVLRRIEVDHLTLPLIVTSSAVYGLLVIYTNLFAATIVAASFWGSLWLYIGAYRAFFHPLQDYPGPFGAKLSRWWTVKETWNSKLHFHRVQQRLQKEYGDYVRTGIHRSRKAIVRVRMLNLSRPARAHNIRSSGHSTNPRIPIQDHQGPFL